jgi:hypothetical protein
VAIALICLIFMGLLQVSEIFAAREILNHAAARGARARTVGFNWWMVEKCVRVASIPNAGKMITPDFENDDTALQGMVESLNSGDLWEQTLHSSPSSLQYNMERARIPEYMATYNRQRGSHILDYENWNTIHSDHGTAVPASPGVAAAMIRFAVHQDYPLWVPLHRAFYRDDSVDMSAQFSMENHYELYIDDMYW